MPQDILIDFMNKWNNEDSYCKVKSKVIWQTSTIASLSRIFDRNWCTTVAQWNAVLEQNMAGRLFDDVVLIAELLIQRNKQSLHRDHSDHGWRYQVNAISIWAKCYRSLVSHWARTKEIRLCAWFILWDTVSFSLHAWIVKTENVCTMLSRSFFQTY